MCMCCIGPCLPSGILYNYSHSFELNLFVRNCAILMIHLGVFYVIESYTSNVCKYNCTLVNNMYFLLKDKFADPDFS